MLTRLASLIYLDFAPQHRQPSAVRVILATVVSLIGSLLVDWLITVIWGAVLPATKGYQHFQFSDYSKLTIIGVIIACIAWPVTTRITSRPRWMFSWMAVIVTIVLWLPDVYILIQGQPGNAVAGLFVMHLAIALVTYNALVHLAPARAVRQNASRQTESAAR
jgi:hypothetical protein